MTTTNAYTAITVALQFIKQCDSTVLDVMVKEPECYVSKVCWMAVRASAKYVECCHLDANNEVQMNLIRRAVAFSASKCASHYYG